MTTENVRIAVRDAQDSQTLAFMDNSAPNAIHFDQADLTRFYEGDSTVLQMRFNKKHDRANAIREGSKLAFIYKGRDYWLNIITAKDVSHQRELMAFSLSLELNKEKVGFYAANTAMSFVEYLKSIDFEQTLTIGINEIADKKLKLDWDGDQSKLGRLYSLANKFDAEISFETILNDDYSLKQQIINIYKKHDESNQGIGQDKTATTLRVGKDLKVINRSASLENFYSAIRGTGKDGISINDIEFEELDANGNVLYFSKKGQDVIWAPQARDAFPSKNNPGNDGYLVEKKGETEYTTVEALKGYLLSELKKNSSVYVDYETEGHFDSDPGDTFSLEDSVYYSPPLYLEARVYEQTESLVLGDFSSDKTTFSNFVEKTSEIDSSLLARVQALIEANKVFAYEIITSDGVTFKNGFGSTTLTARVRDGIKDVTDTFSLKWYKDGILFSNTKTVTINAADIEEKAVFRFEVADDSGNVRGGAEVTVTNVADGKPSYMHTAYAWSADGKDRFTTTYPGENLFSLKVLNSITPESWVGSVSAYLYKFVLKPNTQYILSSNVPSSTTDTTVYFNGTSTTVNGVWAGKSVIQTTNSSGEIFLAIVTKRPYTEHVLSGEYWLKFEEGATSTIYTPSPQDDFENAYPKWEGSYSDNLETASDNPADYEPWKIIKGQDGQSQKVHRGWKMPDGRFTKQYPNVNLFRNSESPNAIPYAGATSAKTTNVAVPEWGATNAVKYAISGGTSTIACSIPASGRTTAGVKENYDISIYIKNTGTAAFNISGSFTTPKRVEVGEVKRVTWSVKDYSHPTGAYRQFSIIRLTAGAAVEFVVWRAMYAYGTYTSIWVPSPIDDPLNAYPSLEGMYADFNEEGSNNPDDYAPWTPIRGEDGIAGKDGLGVSSTVITYTQSTSGTTPPTTGWTAQVPSLVKGQYLWTRTVWTYTDNTTETGYTVSYNAKDGNDGTDGIAGKDGVGIASTKVEYVGSSSGTVKPTTGWTTTIPTVAEGSYLWTRMTWTYTDNTSEIGYSVAKMGPKGDKGDKGDSAPTISLSGATQVITVSKTGVITPSSSFTVVGTPVNTTITTWLYSVDGGAFITTLPTGVTRSTNTVTINPATSTFKTLSIRAADATVMDIFTIARIVEAKDGADGKDGTQGAPGKDGTNGTNGSNGADAYTVFLTNESYTFAGSTTAALAGSTTTEVIVYKGINKITPTSITVGTKPTGLSSSVSGSIITLTATTALVSKSGTVPITITADGKTFTKQFSYALSLQGATGSTGKGVAAEEISYAISQNGTTPPTSGWSGTRPTPKAGWYMWTRTRFKYTDNTYSAYFYLVAQQGKDAIIISATPPTNPAKEDLWQDPNDATSTVYKWDGTKWIHWGISINNLIASNVQIENGVFKRVEGALIVGSEFQNPYVVTYNDKSTSTGSVVVKGSMITNSGLHKNSSGVREYAYESVNGPNIITMARYADDKVGDQNKLLASMGLTYDRLTLNDKASGFAGDLTAEMLFDTGWVNLTVLKGSGQIRVRKFMKRYLIQFADYAWNGTGPNQPADAIAILPPANNPGRDQLFNVKVWSIDPNRQDAFQLNKDGRLYKLSNNSQKLYFRETKEVFD